MSTTASAVLLTAALTTGFASAERITLPREVIDAGLKKASCTIPPKDAVIVGTERLSGGLTIVEVACWRAAYNSGSILFAVPENRPRRAQLLSIEPWQNGRVRNDYAVSSPGFDAATRTLSSSHKARGAGDCGTIQEMKWTGWHFRLLNVWNKDNCDGDPIEWANREGWQVFPRQAAQRRGLEPDRRAPVDRRQHVRMSR